MHKEIKELTESRRYTLNVCIKSKDETIIMEKKRHEKMVRNTSEGYLRQQGKQIGNP